MKCGRIAGVVLVGALALPPAAGAETFCVEKPSCDGTNQPTLQDAIAAAGASPGIPDRIELGGKPFEEGPYVAADDNPVKIIGAGRTRTTLERSTGAGSQTVLSLEDRESSVSALAIDVGDGNGSNGLFARGRATGILVESTSASTDQRGVVLQGGSLTRSAIKLANSPGNLGINMFEGARASEVSIRTTRGIEGAGEVERARVRAVEFGIKNLQPSLEVDQATIEVTGTGSTALLATSGFGLTPQSMTARHVTMIGDPTDGATGAAIDADPSFSFPGTAELVLRNSITYGFATDLLRNGSDGDVCPPLCPTAANFDVAWTVFDPAKVSESGPGAFTYGPGNLSADPRFAKPGARNYRLKASSPLVERGQKGKPAAGESKVDLDGRKRVLDGDGDGKARRDIGAFERPKR